MVCERCDGKNVVWKPRGTSQKRFPCPLLGPDHIGRELPPVVHYSGRRRHPKPTRDLGVGDEAHAVLQVAIHGPAALGRSWFAKRFEAPT